jgi:hypothetical protein
MALRFRNIIETAEFINLLLTNKCNKKCNYCYEQHNIENGKWDKDKIEKLMQKGNVYAQYTDTRSRSKLSSGNIVKLTNDSVIIDRNNFGEKDIEVKFDLIQFATNMKKS